MSLNNVFVQEPTLLQQAKEMDDLLKKKAEKEQDTQPQINELFKRTEQLLEVIVILISKVENLEENS